MISAGAARRLAWGALAALVFIAGGVLFDPRAAVEGIAALGPSPVLSSVPYGEGVRRTLDAYAPTAPREGAPIVVFFYGGSWNSGAKEAYRFIGAALALRGLAAVIPDYRVYPDVRFPAFLEDGAAVVRWAKDNAARLHGDPRRIIVMGHSAGAYIAAMLAFDRHFLNAVGVTQEDLCGVIGLAGPYSFLLHSDLLRGVFGSAPDQTATQPINFVDRNAPPAFLATGTEDETVRPKNTFDLAERIHSAGGQATVVIYSHITHRQLIGAFSPALRFLAPVLDDVTAFVERVSTRCSPAARD